MWGRNDRSERKAVHLEYLVAIPASVNGTRGQKLLPVEETAEPFSSHGFGVAQGEPGRDK